MIDTPRGNCIRAYGLAPGYGPGFGTRSSLSGPWFGARQPEQMGFPGLGWAVYSALAEGSKTDKEVADWVTSKINSQITPELVGSLLQIWAFRGIVKRDSSNKYSLTWAPSPAPTGPQRLHNYNKN
ncbi:hypothetical protein [Tardisphaera saccharovorans]